jgi:hypothetical protein
MSEEIGTGIKFPFRFDERTGGVKESDGLDRIRESLQEILGTRIGERLKRPDFGSRIRELLFEGSTEVVKTLMKHHVVEAIRKWEPRVRVKDLELRDKDNHFSFLVFFTFKNQSLSLQIDSKLFS